MPRPQQNEYPQHVPPFMVQYISLVEGNSIAEIISRYSYEQVEFIDALPNDKANFAYAENKWTVKEVVQHIIDAERIFAYRVLSVARGETQTLTGFDQDVYVKNSNVLRRSFDDIKEEFKAARYATNILLRSLSEEQLLRIGNVADYRASAKAFAFNIYGHAIHHQNILREKYGLP